MGESTAKAIAKSGANLAVNAPASGALLGIMQEIIAGGGQIHAIPGALRELSVCRRIVSEVVGVFGRIDVIINYVGKPGAHALIRESNPKDWLSSWETMVLGPVMLTKIALPFLRSQAGRVINVLSSRGVHRMPGRGAFVSAQAALEQFNRVLAAEEPSITAITLAPRKNGELLFRSGADRGAVSTASLDDESQEPDPISEKTLSEDQIAAMLAWFAMYAPHPWSGKRFWWDDDQVRALVNKRVKIPA
jgi:NAD(P)-dependent dehydrogenase (short-subunit alcohol dehydrogenase family)